MNLFQFEPERDVVIDVVVRKQSVSLEHRVDRPLVRGQIRDVFSAQQDFARSGDVKARDHAQRRRFAASGRPEKGDKFSLADVKTHVLNGCGFVKDLGNVDDLDNFFFFF